MPELPEVETIRAGLARKITGKLIERVVVGKPKIIRGSARSFVSRLRGKSFSAVRRHGKLLILPVANEDIFLLIHLKMTGQLIYQDKSHVVAGGHGWPPLRSAEAELRGTSSLKPSKYTHVIFDFADGSRLFFNDLRQFGFLELVDERTLGMRLARMGIDPLLQDLTLDDFQRMIRGRNASIKAVLLNQQLIAGIGNIYADEICFAAKVRPQRKAGRLTQQEQRALWQAIPRVLRRALKHGGTTFKDFRDADGGQGNFTRLLKVYGRGGARCKRCKVHDVKKIIVAQRGTHYCPNCQT